jgi:hypothetical protein
LDLPNGGRNSAPQGVCSHALVGIEPNNQSAYQQAFVADSVSFWDAHGRQMIVAVGSVAAASGT